MKSPFTCIAALAAVANMFATCFCATQSSVLSVQLQHASVAVRASSLNQHPVDAQHAAAAVAAAASASLEEVQAASDFVFHKAKYAAPGSIFLSDNAAVAPAPLYKRKLDAKDGDQQFFVQFSTPTDAFTLLAFHLSTRGRIVAHVQSNLYIALGGSTFDETARQFPGVAWVQLREESSKISVALRGALDSAAMAADDAAAQAIVAECWLDGCFDAATAVKTVCPGVYVHPTLVEAVCPASALQAAVSILAQHIAVDHVDVKHAVTTANFGGRVIVSAGADPSPSTPLRVLSSISVENSTIAVSDSGIDMNNCFFYDENAAQAPWNNSRVVTSYRTQPCQNCGKCCIAGISPPGCTNDINACGNFKDESAHGTHVSGTIAGQGPPPVAYANGVANGSKIFFQDIENVLDNSVCYRRDACGFSGITDLMNLFAPAAAAGARVHSNSFGWGQSFTSMNLYFSQDRSIDAFASSNPDSLIIFSAGNQGSKGFGTVTKTCKNCLMTGATQQSDALFRTMKPYVDPGFFCQYQPSGVPLNACCSNSLTCASSLCCDYTSNVNMSLACCESVTNCQGGQCSVESGNLRSSTNLAFFSSLGPTADGRFKPDLVVPGEDTLSAATPDQTTPGSFVYTKPGHCVVPSQSSPRTLDDNRNNALKLNSGTSMAAPLLAGAAEKIRQYFVQGYYPLGVVGSGVSFSPDAALVRAVILASCEPLAGAGGQWQAPGATSRPYPFNPGFYRLQIPSTFSPNFFEGFGAPVIDHAVPLADYPNGYNMSYQNSVFTPSSAPSAFAVTCDPNSSIRVALVLVWTDPAGSVSGSKQLVNDLDLVVVVGSSQFFGNMRLFADDLNTVERVVLPKCPDSGTFTAVVAAGEPIKTDTQSWYLVVNGPVIQVSPTSTPGFRRGRLDPPATQSDSCLFLPGINVRLLFQPAAVWKCARNCISEIAMFQMSLVQAVGVGAQGVRVYSFDQSGISFTLQCTAAINSWQTGSVSLKYVTPISLLNSVQNAYQNISSVFSSDPALLVFNWTTLSAMFPPPASIVVVASAYNDSKCQIALPTFFSAPNPFTFTDGTCTPGFVTSTFSQFFFKAISCNNGSNGTVAVYLNDPSCTKTGALSAFTSNKCTFNPAALLPQFYESGNCSNVIAPAPPQTSSNPPSTSPAPSSSQPTGTTSQPFPPTSESPAPSSNPSTTSPAPSSSQPAGTTSQPFPPTSASPAPPTSSSPASPTPPSDQVQGSSQALSTTAVAGISVGAVLLVAVAAAVCCRHRIHMAWLRRFPSKSNRKLGTSFLSRGLDGDQLSATFRDQA